MFTKEAADVLRWPGVGSVRAGNYADLMLVDRDPFAVELEELPAVSVLATIVDGRKVWQKE
jgi:predicted amidohydrolase YtcJ